MSAPRRSAARTDGPAVPRLRIKCKFRPFVGGGKGRRAYAYRYVDKGTREGGGGEEDEEKRRKRGREVSEGRRWSPGTDRRSFIR